MSQKISGARFAKMSQRFEREQGENAKRIKALRLELKKSEGQRMNIDTFLETVRRYTNATEITQRIVAELIDHIDVYHAEKKDGVTTRTLQSITTVSAHLLSLAAGISQTWKLKWGRKKE